MRKKQLEKEGKLGKFGKILDSTPTEIREEFGDVVKTQGEATKKESGVETLSAVGGATPTPTITMKKKVTSPLDLSNASDL